MVRDFLDPPRRDAPAAQHVLEKRPHVGRALGTAEGHDQHGIEWRHG